MMAIVSINVMGIVVSFFQLLFRSYIECMTIRYLDSSRKCWKNGLKRKISSPIAIPQDECPLVDDSNSSMHKCTSTRTGCLNRMDIDKSLPPTPIREKPDIKDDNDRKP